jgi:hypothetical protein
VLQRFLIEQPPDVRAAQKKEAKRPSPPHERPGRKDEPAPEPLPEAEQVRLDRAASCVGLLDDARGPLLVFGGPRAEGKLGMAWSVEAETLPWEVIAPRERTLRDAAPLVEPTAPDFTPTRTKITGPALRSLAVDDVIAARGPWMTTSSGALLERPIAQWRRDEPILAGDVVLLPAMVRAHAGTCRPALAVWAARQRAERDTPEIGWVVWGDRPRGWIALETPQIREQRWTRSEVFPLTVALGASAPDAAGERPAVPAKWRDAELFDAMVRECRAKLEVLW